MVLSEKSTFTENQMQKRTLPEIAFTKMSQTTQPTKIISRKIGKTKGFNNYGKLETNTLNSFEKKCSCSAEHNKTITPIGN